MFTLRNFCLTPSARNIIQPYRSAATTVRVAEELAVVSNRIHFVSTGLRFRCMQVKIQEVVPWNGESIDTIHMHVQSEQRMFPKAACTTAIKLK